MYTNKDKYLIEIYSNDDKILYFSRQLLYNKCGIVKMLENRNQLTTLTLDFSENQISRFLLYIESDIIDISIDEQKYEIIEYIKDICYVANYLDYDNNSSNISNKSIIIDMLLDTINTYNIYNIDEIYNINLYKLIYFNKYKYKYNFDININLINNLINFNNEYDNDQYKLKFDWIDILDLLYNDLYSSEKFKLIYEILYMINFLNKSNIKSRNDYNTWLDHIKSIDKIDTTYKINNYTNEFIDSIKISIDIIYPE